MPLAFTGQNGGVAARTAAFICGILAFAVGVPAVADTPHFHVVHEFNGLDVIVPPPHGHGPSADGNTPYGRLLRADDGTLYATTCKGGYNYLGGVFSFSPPTPVHPIWSEKNLFGFEPGHGACPVGGLIFDQKGGFFGTAAGFGPVTQTSRSSSPGVVFELSPPQPGDTEWKETVLYTFNDRIRGLIPNTTLLRDKAGALYGLLVAGAAHNSGGVFKLSPPTGGQTAWTETLLYSFAPSRKFYFRVDAPLIIDKSGALYTRDPEYGTNRNGAIIKLTPPRLPSGRWSSTVLYAFAGGADGDLPLGGLVMGTDGALFGTTGAGGDNDAGTVFKLEPPATPRGVWKHKVLFVFPPNGAKGLPTSSLLFGKGGVMYGANFATHFELGTIFEIMPPASGSTHWTQRILEVGSNVGGIAPVSSPILDPNGVLYGTTSTGGSNNTGTLYQITP